MDKNSTNYVLFFVVTMTVIVAFALTSIRQATKATADQNEDIFNKRAVLAAVNDYLGMGENVGANDLTDEQVLEIFNEKVEQTTLNTQGQEVDGVMAEDIDMAKEKKKDESERVLPLFKYAYEGQEFYILSVRGNGLWDEIWGNIALKSDISTIAGASFDHKGETPGLGAEIKDNPTFSDNFKDKEIFRDGEFVSVKVRKGGAQDPTYEVDGISGATVTADGVDKMLRSGIALYLPYLNKIKGSGMESMLQE
ncbi:NADH:ubiquinone reductase (Na(+)-transporting) subunit C [Lewinella cohaerens]|uniref:NADH:ubiquinone reductase (Na(+)-transporting) subunit C n=1 Tax=Lewinella cohaerens TaxID=70995 RepID=UPI00036C6A20|nr:NADH:ubiquinone reductase (Na(+)-transporting) subunit C [Lewinella cohaerens]